MRQHLACVQAAAAVCGARVQGAELHSTSLHFEPGPVKAGEHTFLISSAGSCTLVLQTVLPALMLADGPSSLQLGGGTHNPMAPPHPFIARSVTCVRMVASAAECSRATRMRWYIGWRFYMPMKVW